MINKYLAQRTREILKDQYQIPLISMVTGVKRSDVFDYIKQNRPIVYNSILNYLKEGADNE